MIIQNALVYTPRHTFEKGSIVIREGRIVPFAAPEEGEEVLDAQGLYALPGLVDIHFHGAMGKDFCDGKEEAIQTLADFEASKGVLAICPATMTFSEEILNGVMDAAAAHKNGKGADLVGINMEGPFISPHKVGAQNPEYLHKADVEMFRRLQKRAKASSSWWTLPRRSRARWSSSKSAMGRSASRWPTPAPTTTPPLPLLTPVPPT